MLKVYDFTGSGNGYKVWLLLRQLSVPYTRIECDILKGETRTPAFLAKNPNGRIPTLELEDGTYLAESGAILWYLAGGTAMAPDDEWRGFSEEIGTVLSLSVWFVFGAAMLVPGLDDADNNGRAVFLVLDFAHVDRVLVEVLCLRVFRDFWFHGITSQRGGPASWPREPWRAQSWLRA